MMLILNDLHLGVKRSSGTTLESQAALKEALYTAFEQFIETHGAEDDLTINGDLFDGFTVDPQDVLRTYLILHGWLTRHGNRLILVGGNHDWSPRGDKLSSFHMLGNLLRHTFSTRVQVIDASQGLTEIFPGLWAIPHMPNQDLFDLELGKAKDLQAHYLLLHCNVASTFAEHSDHSLNITWTQMDALPTRLIFGHEHQGRSVGRHIVVGNQWPSSISDCLAHGEGQRDGLKRALRITDDYRQELIKTWDAADNFAEVDWRDLDAAPDLPFIRAVGTATAEEAAEVVGALSRFRSKSKALVIGNAVKVDGVQGMDTIAELSFEQVKAFDVLSALLEMLDPEEQKVVRELIHVDTN